MFLFIFFYRTTFGVEKPVFVSEKQQQKNVSTKQDKYTAKGYEHSVTATAICCNGRNQKSSLEDSSWYQILQFILGVHDYNYCYKYFKAALINKFKWTMDHVTMCNVKGSAHSDKLPSWPPMSLDVNIWLNLGCDVGWQKFNVRTTSNSKINLS